MGYGLLDQGDREQALYHGLLAASAGLLGNGPSRTPQGGLAGLGQALQGFGQGTQAGMNQAVQGKFTAMQLAEMQRKQAEQAALRERMGAMFTPPPGAPTNANAQQAPINQFGFTPQQIEALRALPPEAQAQVIQQRAFAPPEGPLILAPGAQARDRRTNAVIAENPRSDRPNEFEALLAVVNDPRRSQSDRDLARAVLERKGTPPTTTVNLPPGEKALAVQDAKRIGDVEDALSQSRRILPDIDRLEAAVRSFPTGTGGSGVLAFRQALERVGVKIDGTSEGEVIQSIQSKLTPAMRPPGSGSSSDKDVSMFLEALPNLFRSQEGNLAVIRHIRTLADRQQKEARFMRSFYEKNGSLAGVYDEMDKSLGPVFPRVKTPQEADMLAKGSVFVDPSGVMRVR